MSRVNFDNLISEHPESKRALRKIQEWLNKQPDKTVLYPRDLARAPLSHVDLARVLDVLVDAGVLRRVYKVTTPSGVLADAEFDDPREIPEKLPDRWEHYFDTAESDVVPVFQKVA